MALGRFVFLKASFRCSKPVRGVVAGAKSLPIPATPAPVRAVLKSAKPYL